MADLTICAMCKSDCVVPVDWEGHEDRWLIHRRCGACGWRSVGIWADDVAERYDELLDAGCNVIAQSLLELQVARFACQLQDGEITADHFRVGIGEGE